MHADEDSPSLARVSYGDYVLRATVGGTYAEQLVALPSVNGQPAWEMDGGGDGPIDISITQVRDPGCDREIERCTAYLVEPSLSEEFGLKIGELWEDRLQVYIGDQKASDYPVLNVR